MKETKEMMIKLPMVTATSYEELNKARIYPQSGRYIVKMDNGDAVMITTSMKADNPSRCLIDTTDGTACSHPSRQQAMRDYEHSVIRCRDGRPAISFISWFHWAGINPWEL